MISSFKKRNSENYGRKGPGSDMLSTSVSTGVRTCVLKKGFHDFIAALSETIDIFGLEFDFIED